MLGRAATNAYSWWWASHIRTKQSKWLEQNMEDVMAETLNIIHNEGESFSQRAEMYYRKRPQLVGYVEEVFRSYRALADRYDLLSKELQSANRTIAIVFPEQVRCRIDEDDVEESFPGTNSSSQDHNNQTPKPGIPKAPNFPNKDLRSPSMLLSKKGPLKRVASSAKSPSSSPSSGLSKAEALAKVDKLQKEILALQTEKEFVWSLYENSYEKHWEIEDRITEMQKRVCSLQDEFGINTMIEDNDARALMAATALNSCKETLAKLQETQAQSSEEAKESYQRVKEARDMFETIRGQFISKLNSQEDQGTEPKSIEEEDMSSLEEERHEPDVELLRDTIKEKLEKDSGSSLSMTEMTEKIDELVNKVITLEIAVSSQTGLVKRLRSEADKLQKNILSLEEDKEVLTEDSEGTKKKLEEVEEELRRVKILYQSANRQDNSLQTHFAEASCDLEHLSGKLNDVKLDEEGENLQLHKNKSAHDGEIKVEFEKSGDNTEHMKDVETAKEDCSVNFGDVENEDNKSNSKENIDFRTEEIPEQMLQNKDDLSEARSNLDTESLDQGTGEEENQSNRSQMMASGLDDGEKILTEFTSVLKNYEDVKDELNDVVKKNQDSIFQLALQVRELRDTVETKDQEINILQQMLTCSKTNPDESPSTPLTDYKHTPQEALLGTAAQGTDPQDPENPSSNTNASAVTTSYAGQHQKYVENKARIGILMKVRSNQLDRTHSLSTLEKKFRSNMDDLLEENLEFWLRFSTSVHQVQKFQSSIQDLKFELKTIRDNMSQENSSSIQSEIKPIFRHLREIRTELSLWLEHSEELHEELQCRHPSLCTLQDEIARAANPNSASSNNMAKLSGYQAAKFQGEILNMKQESIKVSSELQACVSFVKELKGEVEKMVEELSQEVGVNNHDHMKHSTSRPRIPLKSFLFGIKLRKQKQTVLSCVTPTKKQHRDLALAEEDAPI
ncbi:Protein NETWORKED 2A [Glycine max]|nr:Protein NETWORKED 2A [Glycine max]